MLTDKKHRAVIAVMLVIFLSAAALWGCASKNGQTQDGKKQAGTITGVKDLAGKTMGVEVGSIYDKLTQQYIKNPKVAYYNSRSDLIQALASGKIDAYLADLPTAISITQSHEELDYLKKPLADDYYGFAFNKDEKGIALSEKMSAYIQTLKKDGGLKKLDDKWFGEDEDAKTSEDSASFPATNGSIVYGTNSAGVPFAYVKDGKVVGYEIDIITGFCKENGFALEIQDMEFSALIPAVTSGKCDIVGSSISITDERKESVQFSDAHYDGGVVVMMQKETDKAPEGFWASIKDSFEKNFIRESRWKLIAEGIGTTMLISVLAAIFGTILGFGVCMLRRRKNRLTSGIARAYIQVVQGTPIVVLLMILYYIVFGSVDIWAVWVAVIGFSINFAAYVSEMMRTGIESVGKGQEEAAEALGFSRVQTFVKIILPQAAKHFLPVYKGEFISMVKMTSVVGYIAIRDLTKMSDIIRSRTYEAFFPLIMTAVIYFIIAWILTRLLNLVELRIDPKRRKRRVKGVITP